MFIWAALLMGFIGSFHCIGMCGPIALTLPGSSGAFSFLIERILYNTGRIVTYAMLGAVVGIAGGMISMAGWQGPFSILLGTGILVFTLLPKGLRESLQQIAILQYFLSKLKQLLALFMKQHSKAALFITGLLNGFLPCGFVYIGLAGAASTGSSLQAIIFMVFFGMGTLPAMMLVSLGPRFFSPKLRNGIQKVMPYMAVIVGILLVFRGLNLGIPLISPGLTH